LGVGAKNSRVAYDEIAASREIEGKVSTKGVTPAIAKVRGEDRESA